MDVLVMTLRRHDLFKGTLPSKIFEALGAAVPVVAALEGEAQRLIAEGKCGICVEPENPAAIAEAILRLFHDPALRKRLGENGREYVSKYYNRKEIANRFERVLTELFSANPPV